jgi:hypothetical protein
VLLAVAVTLATPEAFVDTNMLLDDPALAPLDNRAPAPLDGAEKPTETLLTGRPAESLTVTESADGKAVLTAADCGVPPDAMTLAIFTLVSENVADCPPALAITV